MEAEKFIREVMVAEIRALLKHDHERAAFVMMGQSIEVLGAFLDDKPLKARQQSKKRFRNALYHLFPGKYSSMNRGDRLYNEFRSSLTHMLVPSARLKLTSRDMSGHLTEKEGKLVLHAGSLADDIERAGEAIIKRLNSGELRRKRIGFDWQED
ncbi:MAG: hypothetical protein ACQES0_07590 [Bacteroidota bacterium]